MKFDRLTNYISGIDFALLAFISFTIRIVLVGASWGDAIALLGFVSLIGFNRFLTGEHKKVNEQVRKDIIQLKDSLTATRMDKTVRRFDEQGQKKRLF